MSLLVAGAMATLALVASRQLSRQQHAGGLGGGSNSATAAADSSAAQCEAWLSYGPLPAYPRGDCATQCSHNLASDMRACAADAAAGIPATACAPLPGGAGGACPTLRYPDAM